MRNFNLNRLFGMCGAMLFAVSMHSHAFADVVFGQIDDFEDGSRQGWTNGLGGFGQANISTGGPAGDNDNYLQVSSGSLGGPSRPVALNVAQWVNNYTASNVTAIEMDLKNFGASPLSMRIAFRQFQSNSFTPAYITTNPFVLPADGSWHHAVFELNDSALGAFNTSDAVQAFINTAGEFRLFSSTSFSPIGDTIDARFGVDNITAIPEASTGLIALTLLLTAFVRHHR